jgi:hypothetical protein
VPRGRREVRGRTPCPCRGTSTRGSARVSSRPSRSRLRPARRCRCRGGRAATARSDRRGPRRAAGAPSRRRQRRP